jgi:hypothetical protein
MSLAVRRVLGLAVVPALVLLAACFASSTTGCGAAEGGAKSVPAESATRFQLAHTFCGAAVDSCAGNAAVTIVDFRVATLETHRCVELMGDGGPAATPAAPPGTSALFGSRRGDAISARPLTPTEVSSLRAALGDVKFVPAKLTELDGAMTVLTVDGPSGSLTLTPAARCGAPDYRQIVEGLPALQAALDAL